MASPASGTTGSHEHHPFSPQYPSTTAVTESHVYGGQYEAEYSNTEYSPTAYSNNAVSERSPKIEVEQFREFSEYSPAPELELPPTEVGYTFSSSNNHGKLAEFGNQDVYFYSKSRATTSTSEGFYRDSTFTTGEYTIEESTSISDVRNAAPSVKIYGDTSPSSTGRGSTIQKGAVFQNSAQSSSFSFR